MVPPVENASSYCSSPAPGDNQHVLAKSYPTNLAHYL